MSKWREVRLGEYIDTLKGNAFKSSLYKDNGIPIVRASNFTDRSIEKDKMVYMDYDEDYDRFILERKDVLCQTVGSWLNNPNSLVGKIVRVPDYLDGSYLNQNIVKITPDENLDNNYLFYRLKVDDYKHYCVDNAQGAANQASITLKTIRRFKFSLPDLQTQEKIADILSTYDDLIENNNRRIEILEKTVEEIYKEWFVRMRFPGHENTKFIKGIPEGWAVKRVGDLAKFKRGKNLVIRDAIPGEVPVIAGGMEPSCYHNESNTNAPVITVSASGANAGYTQLNHVDVWASDCSYIDINDTYLIYYIYLLLKVSHKEILNLQLGSAQPHVYARDLNNFKFLKPDMKLIKKINNHAKDIFGEIKYLSSTNQNLIKQRDLLLPRLMNGTIEVK